MLDYAITSGMQTLYILSVYAPQAKQILLQGKESRSAGT